MYTSRLASTLLALGSHLTYALPSTENFHHLSDRDTPIWPQGITAQQAADAFPPRDAANITNWFGTSLFGWDKCDDWSPKVKEWIKEAYADANELANQEGVKSDIDWNSAAAFEFLGPTSLNKNQQPQIQAVLANMADVKEGTSPWTPNWIRARCDDPNRLCSAVCPEPGEELKPGENLAYTRNPGNRGNNEAYPDISFCPAFFAKRNLAQAMRWGSGSSRPSQRFNLDEYDSRASILLHELFHVDIAADSVRESPNPHIRDLKIKFKYSEGPNTGKTSRWTKVYGPTLSKTLARFVPLSPTSTQTGYFVQRNSDNFVYFTLANYVQKKLGSYPFLPAVYNKIVDAPLMPLNRTSIDYISYSSNGNEPAVFNLTDSNAVDSPGFLSTDGDCPTVQSSDQGIPEDLELGVPVPQSMIPAAYADARFKFLSYIKDLIDVVSHDTCSIDVEEIWTCEESAKNLHASITIKSAHGSLDYVTPHSFGDLQEGEPINNANPLSIKNGSMQHDMIITGEHRNDYIQFVYDDLAWNSSSTDGVATCKLNGEEWNPEGPRGCPTQSQTRSFSCRYPCAGKVDWDADSRVLYRW